MSSLTASGTYKKTFSIKKPIVERLNNYKNKSRIVNNALFFYFKKEDYLKKAEEDFFNSIELENFSEKEIQSLLNSKENKSLDKTISSINF